MNEEILERLRDPQLRPALRGYDRLEVEALLHDIADLIEARGLGVPEGQKAIGELPGVSERVESIVKAATDAAEHVGNEAGKRAAEVTQEAEQSAEHMRREADGYAAETRKSADRYAAETRTAAEQESTKLREESGRMAEATTAAAEEQAAEILREAELERDRVKASIVELRQQRQGVVESIERMRGNLDSMVGDVEKGTEQFIAVGGAAAATSALEAAAEVEPEAEAAAEVETPEEPAVEEHPVVEQEAVEELLETEEPLTGEEDLEERRPGEGVTGVVFDDEEDEEDIIYPTGRDETQPFTTEDFDSLEQPSDDEWVEGDEDSAAGLADRETDDGTEVLELPDEGRRRRG